MGRLALPCRFEPLERMAAAAAAELLGVERCGERAEFRRLRGADDPLGGV